MNRIALCTLLAAASFALAGCQSAPPAQPRPPEPLPTPKAAEVSPKDRAVLHVELGAGYYERGQMDVAIEELSEAVKLDPNNAQAYNIFGLVYAILGENAKAEQNFQRGISLAPGDSEIRQNWGWYLCTHGNPRASIAEFEAALRNPLYKTPEVALVNAGRCSMELGENSAADAYFRRALAAAPNDAIAAYSLALLSFREKKYTDARNLMKIVMQQTNPTPWALYLGMCVERALGDKSSETSYVTQLRNRYPDSIETKQAPTGKCE